MEPYTRAYSLALQLQLALEQLPENHPDLDACRQKTDQLIIVLGRIWSDRG